MSPMDSTEDPGAFQPSQVELEAGQFAQILNGADDSLITPHPTPCCPPEGHAATLAFHFSKMRRQDHNIVQLTRF